MMVAMNPRTAFGFCAVLAVLAASVAVLSELNHESGSASLTWTMISRFVVVMAFGTFGIYSARESNLRGSIVVTSDDVPSALQDLINYGVLPGLVLGLINYLFFFRYRYSPFVVPRIREMESVYDSFIISLDSAFSEEVIYRLFIMSCLLYVLQQLYKKIRPTWPFLVSVLPSAMALVLSSLLFALAHNIYGFTAALLGGLLLGAIYLRSGIESAIAAHFGANFLFFSAVYLTR